MLFQTTKIQTFESNSQPLWRWILAERVVSDYKDTNFWKQFTTLGELTGNVIELFQTTKIQTFESNSQRHKVGRQGVESCFRLQRYKLLKAIHNGNFHYTCRKTVVSDYKDTNFWKQFTTGVRRRIQEWALFQTTKIQTFESNSQQSYYNSSGAYRCFRLQRYKLLKAIHNWIELRLKKY